jgi:hypothetical protein
MRVITSRCAVKKTYLPGIIHINLPEQLPPLLRILRVQVPTRAIAICCSGSIRRAMLPGMNAETTATRVDRAKIRTPKDPTIRGMRKDAQFGRQAGTVLVRSKDVAQVHG